MNQLPSGCRVTEPVQVARSSNAGESLRTSASRIRDQFVRSVETAWPIDARWCRASGWPSARETERKNRCLLRPSAANQKSQTQPTGRESSCSHDHSRLLQVVEVIDHS